jgi:restriction system protein
METITKILEHLASLSDLFTAACTEIDDKETELKMLKKFEDAKQCISRIQQLESYSEDLSNMINALNKEYKILRPKPLPQPHPIPQPKGKRTQEVAYYLPLLQALIEFGGRGQTRKMVNRVGEIMKPILRPIDYERLKSAPYEIRWENAAQWARNTLVYRLEYMKKGSPRGIWEISELGRKYYEEKKK